jgi:thioredoxin-related protein
VDRLEEELEGHAEVLRVNVMTRVGVELARRYGVRGVPTLLIFDGAGQVVYSGVGMPNREEIIRAVEQVSGR